MRPSCGNCVTACPKHAAQNEDDIEELLASLRALAIRLNAFVSVGEFPPLGDAYALICRIEGE